MILNKIYWKDKMVSQTARKREEIVKFFEAYGMLATEQAFKVKKSSVYGWRKTLF